MQAANWHTNQVLTKTSERVHDRLNSKLNFGADLQHIWCGVSAEDNNYGLPRIEYLRASAARRKFLSIAPQLLNIGKVNLDGIDWVIVGGESGNGGRPIKYEWVGSLRDQCFQTRVPFFFRQWGGVRKKAAGRQLDGRHL